MTSQAPFTKLHALYYSYKKNGQVVAREVLEFWGQPVVLNELRGYALREEMQLEHTASSS